MVDDVAAHVPHRAGAEVAPASPHPRNIGGMIRPFPDRPEPEVPIQGPGDRRRLLRPADPLFPEEARPIGPGVDFPNLADDPGLDPFVREPRPFRRVPLIPHLGDDPGGLRRLGQLPGLEDRVREGLLGVDVFPGLDRRHRRDGMDVVRRADRHRVDVPGFRVDHLAEILVTPRLRVGVERSGAALFVHVAEGHDVGAELREPGDIAPSHPAGADPRHVQPLAGRDVAGPAEHMARHDQEGRGRGGPARRQKAPARPVRRERRSVLGRGPGFRGGVHAEKSFGGEDLSSRSASVSERSDRHNPPPSFGFLSRVPYVLSDERGCRVFLFGEGLPTPPKPPTEGLHVRWVAPRGLLAGARRPRPPFTDRISPWRLALRPAKKGTGTALRFEPVPIFASVGIRSETSHHFLATAAEFSAYSSLRSLMAASTSISPDPAAQRALTTS